jgi:FKBP-type peptidyl-prolyl cis-trans isomerase (trigger factor)
MLQKQIQKQPKSIVEVQVMVPWADLEQAWGQNLTQMSQEVELPGFRKGSAPVPMVEQHLGQKVQDEFLKNVIPQTLVDALQGTDIVPIDYPQYTAVSFAKGQQLTFSARITQRPEVKVGDYKTIKVTKPALPQVTEEQINQVINDLFARWKSRAGQEGQPANPYSTGEKPDDSFAKAVGANNLIDLSGKIKQDLTQEAQYNNELDYEEAILQEVEKITTVDLPDILIEDELRRMLVSLQRRVADMGLLMEDYLKSQNKTLEGLREEWKEQAEKNVRMELGLSEIARMENVDISEAEVQAEIDKIQDARMKAQFDAQEPRMHLKHSLRQVRTLNLLKSIVQTL